MDGPGGYVPVEIVMPVDILDCGGPGGGNTVGAICAALLKPADAGVIAGALDDQRVELPVG